MKYWDSSAIVPLLVAEEGQALARGWHDEDADIVTWSLTRVEVAGAIERLARTGIVGKAERLDLLAALNLEASDWREVTDVRVVRNQALGLLSRHALSAADAVQLAAAIVASEGGEPLEFVCLDRKLADAAEREGMPVRSWGHDPREPQGR